MPLFFFWVASYQRSRKIELTGAGLLLTRVSSVTWSCLFFATLWTAACQASLSITKSQSLLKHVHVSDALQPSHPLSSPLLLPSIFPSIRVFSNESGGQSIGVSPSASVLPMNLQDWFPLGLTGFISLQSKSLLQHHSSKASILRHSAFFIVQLSHPYMTTGKTIALTRRTFVDKVMSLLFNKLSRLVIAFLPRSKSLLISWLQSPSAVISEPPQIKFLTVSIISPSICHEVMGSDSMILVFWMLSFKFDQGNNSIQKNKLSRPFLGLCFYSWQCHFRDYQKNC